MDRLRQVCTLVESIEELPLRDTSPKPRLKADGFMCSSRLVLVTKGCDPEIRWFSHLFMRL